MNVSGLKNLGVFPQAKAAKGSPSEKDTKSFEDVLSQTESEAAPDAAAPVKTAPSERPVPQAPQQISQAPTQQPTQQPIQQSVQRPVQQLVQAPAQANDVEVEATAAAATVEAATLPGQPAAPSLGMPVLNDRLMNLPANPPIAAAAGKQPVAVNQDGEVDSLTRRVVWSDFLRKMKNELGVSAEDVLGAFQSLSEEELAKPPAQSVDKVVAALGLAGQDAQVAKQYFMDLINKTQPRSLGEELSNSKKQISLTLMSQREMSRRNDVRAVDQLQQKFFMNGAYPRPQDAMAAAPQGQTQFPKAMMDAQGNVTYVNEQPRDQAMPVASPLKGATIDSTSKPGIDVAQMQAADTAQPSPDVDALVKKFVAGQAQSSHMSAASAASSAAAPSVPSANLTASAPAASAAAAASTARAASIMPALPNAESSSADESDYNEYTSDAAYLGALAGTEQDMKTGGLQDFHNQLHAIDGAPVPQMPVSDVVQQAQVMVRDGGGEMKVTLTPDGLGEVAMKVNVKDGKVSVQMITESDEAKKLIERQLGDLKTSLINHNLQVDGIKVDTATNIGKQMEQQYHDAQRQMAQQTLEQFRQDHQGWRNSFFETPALKVYKGQSEAPRDIPGTPTANSRRNNNRRLDLVA